MLSLNDDRHPLRVQLPVQEVRHLGCQPLLKLRTPGVTVHNPRQLGQAEHLPLPGDIGNVRLAYKGEQVMLAHGVQGDIADDDHLIVIPLIKKLDMPPGVLLQPAEDLRIHPGHAVRCLLKALTVRILPDRL